MSAEETIVLPRSGVSCTNSPHAPEVWWAPGDVGYVAHGFVHTEGKWTAWATNDADFDGGTREECIAWLDARVLALRKALLGDGARETVARAIHAWSTKHGEPEDFALFEQDETAWTAFADDVLRALTEEAS